MNTLLRQHQPEIEGLRAIAVLAVLLFHLKIWGFSGGFVGVDMFFVISGYLITKNIIRDIKLGEFTLKKFYIRRIYRLLPALLVTIFVTLVASYFLLTPEHFSSLGNASVASVLSVSNILFWFEAGYFDELKIFKPLLHTWSLGVEEQFYLFWPLLLTLLFSRGSKRGFFIVMLLSIISLAAAQLLVFEHRELVFYWMPFRLSEFAVGALLVFLKRSDNSSWSVSLFSVIGLILVFVSIALYSSNTIFPGLMVLVPCIGTALLIHFAGGSIVYPLLANSVSQMLGRISYSLYLVHWPVIVLVSYWKLGGVGAKSLTLVIPFILLLAWLLHSQVEQRFRLTKVDQKPGRKSYGIICFSALVIVFGASVSVGDGWFWRYSDTNKVVVKSVSGLSEINGHRARLIRQYQSSFDDHGEIVRHYIIGDSFAEDVMLALKFSKPDLNLKLLKIRALCQPIIANDYNETKENSRSCNAQREKIYSDLNLHNAATIYLAASWREPALSNLSSTLKYLRKNTSANIIVFGPRASFHHVPTLVVRYGQELGLNEFVNEYKSPLLPNKVKRIKDMAHDANVGFIDLNRILCPNSICNIISPEDGKVIYSDHAHLSISGAKYLAKHLP